MIQIQDFPKRRRDDGLSKLVLTLPGSSSTVRLDADIESLTRLVPRPKPLALDLLTIAASCYASDKLVDRDQTEDRWTRDLRLRVPVSDPEAWDAVEGDLSRALAFLSGDLWSFEFVPLAGPVYRTPTKRYRPLPGGRMVPDAVCLFSGGLDSLAGAIDLLESEGTPRVLLISHYDAPTGEQEVLGPKLKRAYPRRVRQARVRLRLDPVAGAESTLRTRSLVFLALGIVAANAVGQDVPLYGYENGHIALNVPLTPSRAGACSTRTMHPHFLDSVAGILSAVGLPNPILRPYELKSKGECITECADTSLLRSLTPLSVSCSHPSRRQHWVRKGAGNCGYCVPCMIRRASLHAAGWDDGNEYGLDVCGGELRPDFAGESADDLRAMLDCLRRAKTAREFAEDLRRIVTVDRIGERARLLERGFEEVRTLFRDKGDSTVKLKAGL